MEWGLAWLGNFGLGRFLWLPIKVLKMAWLPGFLQAWGLLFFPLASLGCGVRTTR
jgi:hypothetical protein